MTLVYCERWNNRLNKPLAVMESARARALHDGGGLYTAVSFTDDADTADRAVELRISVGYARVHFFDELRRVTLLYTFGRRGDLLFLKGITSYDYGDTLEYRSLSQAKRMEMFAFDTDGRGEYTVDDTETGEYRSKDLQLAEGADLRSHWEPVPAFGDYASLARHDREGPPIPFG